MYINNQYRLLSFLLACPVQETEQQKIVHTWCA